jgi:hypothetical protein
MTPTTPVPELVETFDAVVSEFPASPPGGSSKTGPAVADPVTIATATNPLFVLKRIGKGSQILLSCTPTVLNTSRKAITVSKNHARGPAGPLSPLLHARELAQQALHAFNRVRSAPTPGQVSSSQGRGPIPPLHSESLQNAAKQHLNTCTHVAQRAAQMQKHILTRISQKPEADCSTSDF